jgi:hypothetical protein
MATVMNRVHFLVRCICFLASWASSIASERNLVRCKKPLSKGSNGAAPIPANWQLLQFEVFLFWKFWSDPSWVRAEDVFRMVRFSLAGSVSHVAFYSTCKIVLQEMDRFFSYRIASPTDALSRYLFLFYNFYESVRHGEHYEALRLLFMSDNTCATVSNQWMRSWRCT